MLAACWETPTLGGLLQLHSLHGASEHICIAGEEPRSVQTLVKILREVKVSQRPRLRFTAIDWNSGLTLHFAAQCFFVFFFHPFMPPFGVFLRQILRKNGIWFQKHKSRHPSCQIHLPGIFWKRTEAGNVFSFVCYCGRTSQRARPCGFGVESYCPPSEFHKMKHAPSLVTEVLSSEWGILWAGWSTRLRATEETTSYQDFQGEREIEIQLNGSWKTKGPVLPSSFLRPLASPAGGGTLQTVLILPFEDTPLHP